MRDYKRVLQRSPWLNVTALMSTRRLWRLRMADPGGFPQIHPPEIAKGRPVPPRLRDWREVYEELTTRACANRRPVVMDCGIPFLSTDVRVTDPGMERSGPPGPLARRNRTAARHRFHRLVAARLRASRRCAGQLGSGDTADRAGDHRQGLRRRMAPRPPRKLTGKRLLWWVRGRRVWPPSNSPGRVTPSPFSSAKTASAAAALRHPGIQDGKAAS